MCCNTVNAQKMIETRKDRVLGRETDFFFRLFWSALSYFAKKFILPYLVLAGPVEIDESKVNHTTFNVAGIPNGITRWMFGMFDRTTKI